MRHTELTRDLCIFYARFGYLISQGNNGYDIIIVDSSDPVGPAESLFQPMFYQVRDRRVSENRMSGHPPAGQEASFNSFNHDHSFIFLINQNVRARLTRAL